MWSFVVAISLVCVRQDETKEEFINIIALFSLNCFEKSILLTATISYLNSQPVFSINDLNQNVSNLTILILSVALISESTNRYIYINLRNP